LEGTEVLNWLRAATPPGKGGRRDFFPVLARPIKGGEDGSGVRKKTRWEKASKVEYEQIASMAKQPFLSK